MSRKSKLRSWHIFSKSKRTEANTRSSTHLGLCAKWLTKPSSPLLSGLGVASFLENLRQVTILHSIVIQSRKLLPFVTMLYFKPKSMVYLFFHLPHLIVNVLRLKQADYYEKKLVAVFHLSLQLAVAERFKFQFSSSVLYYLSQLLLTSTEPCINFIPPLSVLLTVWFAFRVVSMPVPSFYIHLCNYFITSFTMGGKPFLFISVYSLDKSIFEIFTFSMRYYFVHSCVSS